MAIHCQSCQAVLGAEVEGVDLRQVPDAATIDVLEEALERYGVLIFHAQHRQSRSPGRALSDRWP
jgi:alpha-ketoglutarate-dependent taurine dioxygenase